MIRRYDAGGSLTSRYNLFNNGAPLLASLFKLQYRQIFSTYSLIRLSFTLCTYCRILETMIPGTSGGPDVYDFACARADFEVAVVVGRRVLPVAAYATGRFDFEGVGNDEAEVSEGIPFLRDRRSWADARVAASSR
jgi:hypothetical protein